MKKNDKKIVVLLCLAAMLGILGLAFNHSSLCLLGWLCLTLTAIGLDSENENRKISEFEKAKRQRITIENHSNLWDELMDMFNSKTFPRVDTPEWLALNKKCIEADCDYEQNGMPSQSLTHTFVELSKHQEELRLMVEESYKFHWTQVLEMIRGMNFPEKGTFGWEIFRFVFEMTDSEYFKYTGEKGELENTLRRMTEWV